MEKSENNNIVHSTDSNSIIEWQAPEFAYHEKSAGWFIVLGIVSAALLIATILMKNYLFALIIFLLAFLIYAQASKHPKKVNFKISNDGISIEEKTFPFSDLRSFWIFEEPEIMSLSVVTKKLTNPHLAIALGEQDPKKIREVLINYLPEKKHEENISDIIARKINF